MQSIKSAIDELMTTAIKRGNYDRFNFPGMFEDIFDKESIRYIYPKNLLKKEDRNLVFYILHSGYISEVVRDTGNFTFETFRLDAEKITLTRHTDLYRGVKLNLILKCGKTFEFDGVSDSSDDWSGEYSELIQEIYKDCVK